MAIDEPDKIDLVYIDKNTGMLVLTIVDHLDWTDSTAHQQAFIMKVDRYRDFIESGELLGQFPDAQGRPVGIRAMLQYQPDNLGIEFFARLSKRLIDADLHFSHGMLPASNSQSIT